MSRAQTVWLVLLCLGVVGVDSANANPSHSKHHHVPNHAHPRSINSAIFTHVELWQRRVPGVPITAHHVGLKILSRYHTDVELFVHFGRANPGNSIHNIQTSVIEIGIDDGADWAPSHINQNLVHEMSAADIMKIAVDGYGNVSLSTSMHQYLNSFPYPRFLMLQVRPIGPFHFQTCLHIKSAFSLLFDSQVISIVRPL